MTIRKIVKYFIKFTRFKSQKKIYENPKQQNDYRVINSFDIYSIFDKI